MHQDFADWYRIAHVDLGDIPLDTRWKAVNAFSQKASVADLLDTARLLFTPSTEAAGLYGSFSPFKESDNKFSMLESSVEPRVLAGAVLASRLLETGDAADLAALAVVSGSFQGQRVAIVGEIGRPAREYLEERSASLRDCPPAADPDIDFASLISKVDGTPHDGPNLKSVLVEAVRMITTSVEALHTLVRGHKASSALRREESDVLWWLFGGQSRDLHVAFRDLPPPSACLIAAKELADLTTTLPGPFAARSFSKRQSAIRATTPGNA